MDSTFKLGEIKFIHIMLHYGLFTWKGNCYCSFTDVFIAVATNIHNKVSFNIECFKNFLSFSPTLLTLLGALLTLCTLTSAWQFSILFSIHFIMCWQGEFVFNNQEVLQFIIIAFILITLMFDSGVILKGEIRCKSLSGIKGLKEAGY